MWEKLLEIIINIMLKIFGYKSEDSKGIVFNNITTKQMTGHSGFANVTQPLLVSCHEDGGSVFVEFCGRNDVPYGVYVPESFVADGNKVMIQLLGNGIVKMVSGGTIKKGQIVYSSGSGEITATPNAGEKYYSVGIALEDGVRGNLVKVDTSSPVSVTA